MATTAVRLTQLSHGAGCACKLPAGSLREVLAALPAFDAADLLVGQRASTTRPSGASPTTWPWCRPSTSSRRWSTTRSLRADRGHQRDLGHLRHGRRARVRAERRRVPGEPTRCELWARSCAAAGRGRERGRRRRRRPLDRRPRAEVRDGRHGVRASRRDLDERRRTRRATCSSSPSRSGPGS